MPDSELLQAICAVQGKLPTITKDRTAKIQTKTGGTYSYRYVSLDSIVEKVGPLLAEQDLVWLTFPGRSADGQPVLRYRIAHAPSGEQLEDELPLLMGADADARAQGSAITYARRYALCAVLNIVADEDDDAGAAGQPQGAAPAAAKPATQPRARKGATDAQRKRIHALITEKAVTRLELANVLANWDIQLIEGWMDRLTPARDGTASQLIDELGKFGSPLPVVESDVPTDPLDFAPEVPQ